MLVLDCLTIVDPNWPPVKREASENTSSCLYEKMLVLFRLSGFQTMGCQGCCLQTINVKNLKVDIIIYEMIRQYYVNTYISHLVKV